MKKILLIEDDSVTRTILKTVLSSEYDVSDCVSAEEGLKLIEGIDLIICDFKLPGKNGLEFAKEIKDRKIPFIMLTAESDPMKIEESKSAGISGWFTKPFSPDFIAKKLREVFNK